MKMTTTWEVARADWSPFLSQLEALQKDHPVELEVIGPELGDQPLTQRVSLQAIGLVSKGTGAGAIELLLGADGELDHRVFRPSHLYAIQSSSGLIECLSIEGEGESKTLVRFADPSRLPVARGTAPSAAGEAFVREHMSSPARTLPSGSSLAQAFEVMQRHGIRHLPIVMSSGSLVGILSDRELCLAKRERGIAPEDVTVDELMVRSPYTVSPETRLSEAAAVMANRRFGSAVVVERGRVIGLFTTTDALRALV